MIYIISKHTLEVSQFDTIEEACLFMWGRDCNFHLICVEECPVIPASKDFEKILESWKQDYVLCNLEGKPIKEGEVTYESKQFPAFVERYNKSHEKFRWQPLKNSTGRVRDQVRFTP